MSAQSQLAPVPTKHRELFVQHLLEQLASTSQSNFVLLRTRRPESGEYELASYAPQEVNRQNPHLRDGAFTIPYRKGNRCWRGVDPLASWGEMTYNAPDDHTADDFSPAEQSFIYWVRHKAWFPIVMADGEPGLVVLVRGDKTAPYDPASVRDLWVAAQEFMSGGSPGPRHAGFAAALGALDALRRCPDQDTLFRALSHCVCSGAGLGWNRMWVWEQEEGHRYRCRSALGEVNREVWMAATASLSSQPGDLASEVRSVPTDPAAVTDRLHRACSGVRAEPDPASVERAFTTRTAADQTTTAPLVGRFGPDAQPLEGTFRGAIAQAVSEAGAELQEFGPLHTLPLVIGERRYFVLLGQYTPFSPTPSAILTTVYLQHAGAVVREWEIGSAGQDEVD